MANFPWVPTGGGPKQTNKKNPKNKIKLSAGVTTFMDSSGSKYDSELNIASTPMLKSLGFCFVIIFVMN